MKTNKANKQAFTLVELLVVIGIISILAGVLLPAASIARRHAKTVQCMSVLRQIGNGCLMHAQDRKGFLPLSGNIVLPVGTPTAFYSDLEAIPKYLGDSSHLRYAYATAPSMGNRVILLPWHAAIARYLAPTQNLPTEDWDKVEQAIDDNRGIWKYFMCPETDALEKGWRQSGRYSYPEGQGTVMDVSVTFSSDASSFRPIYLWSTNTDYTLNDGLLGWVPLNSTTRRLRGLYGKVRCPSQTVLMTDGQRRTDLPDKSYPTFTDGWQCWTPVDSPAMQTITMAAPLFSFPRAQSKQNFDYRRHKGKMNVVFVDGHVETRKIDVPSLSDIYLLPPP